MNHEQAALVHDALAEGQWVDAANLIMVAEEQELVVTEKKEAELVVRTTFQNLLEADDYLTAAALQWSRTQFDPRPSVTQQIFEAISKNAKLLIMAGSSLSKTYSAGVYFLLDFMRDPYLTNIKLLSANETNLRQNLHSHMSALLKTAVIPMKEELLIRDSDLTINIKGWIAEMGISGIAIKQGTISSGGLRGHKPKPLRKIAHPKFGHMSRVRVLVDESQDVAAAAFGDLITTESSIDGVDLVKIVCPFNPVDLSRKVVEMAEPPEGWHPDQLETLYNYEGKSTYQVLRLDAARFENITERKKVYPGFITYQTYVSFLRAGDNAAVYYVARGFPPMRDAASTIIPPEWVQTQRGEAIYAGPVKNVAAADLAFQGADKAVLAVGRYGLASGWRTERGDVITFQDRLNPSQSKPRWVLTVDQLFTLPRSNDTVTMAQELMGRCQQMMISPENVALDMTGNGLGVWSHLTKFWGDVLGINWAEGATEKRVLTDDAAGADTVYDGVSTEMWYAFKRWLDPRVCGLLINPIIPTVPLYRQLTARRYDKVKGKSRVESKDTYKSRHGQVSPDEADCGIMLPHLIRMRFDEIPGLMDPQEKPRGGLVFDDNEKVGKCQIDQEDRLEVDDSHAGDILDYAE